MSKHHNINHLAVLQQAKEFKRKTGTDIRSRRKALGVTQVELAELAGVVQHQVGSIESAKTNYTIETLASITAVLQLLEEKNK